MHQSVHDTYYWSPDYGKGYSVGGYNTNTGTEYIIRGNMYYENSHR